MTKPIIVVKIFYKLLLQYVIQVVKKRFLTSASTDIKVFGHTYGLYNAASD